MKYCIRWNIFKQTEECRKICVSLTECLLYFNAKISVSQSMKLCKFEQSYRKECKSRLPRLPKAQAQLVEKDWILPLAHTTSFLIKIPMNNIFSTHLRNYNRKNFFNRAFFINPFKQFPRARVLFLSGKYCVT